MRDDQPTLAGSVALETVEPQLPSPFAKGSARSVARSLVVRFRAADGTVRTARTNEKGAFAVALPPGEHAVSTLLTEDSPEARISPARVVVQEGRLNRVELVYRPGR
jgi:hypothetical protein